MGELSSTDVQDYKSILGRFCTGVTVVASIDKRQPVGFTCQSFSALSLDPPLVVLCPSKRSTTWPRIRAAERFTVSVLAADQRSVGDRFAKSGTDKFANTAWHRSPGELPVITGSLAWIECTITNEHDAGDHTVVVAAVDKLGAGAVTDPLLFFRGSYHSRADVLEASIA
jgi:3-hydroxy-9,10-secoandrosta-1,3,5(10)-triene-9,17-dione monooxygenase reductase component